MPINFLVFTFDSSFLVFSFYLLLLKVFAFEHGDEFGIAEVLVDPLGGVFALFAYAVHALVFLTDGDDHEATDFEQAHKPFGEDWGATGDEDAVVAEVFHLGYAVPAVA
jgi:hypothetical protein